MSKKLADDEGLVGFLAKDAGLFRTLMKNKKQFRLKGSMLTQYEDDSTTRWNMDVWGSKIEPHVRNKEISIISADKKVSLTAFSDEEFDIWLTALYRASGTNFDKFYEMGRQIGSGAYGKVFEGKNKATGELVAIKTIEKSRASAKELKYIQRESAILTRVDHPNIVKTYDVFDMGETYVFVMEHMGGGELFDMIAEAKRFTEAQAADVMSQIVSGISYLHSLGIVHRDIKPENVLCVSKTWPLHVKLTDFGLSNVMDVNSKDALVSFVGTQNYFAPEVFMHQKYGTAVDVFSSGVVLYIMLSGKFPFWGKTESEYWERLRKGVKFPPKQWENVSELAKDLLRSLLELDANKRPAADQICSHPWFKQANEDNAIDNDLTTMHSSRRAVAMDMNS
mmetsp:Transcript_11386/g.19484  ORF Transcript_11386/g.19484 Transcript_11386/m.19484 type:complete len:394 (-) Transcript_11386:125-1306(-)|eukprot:CAMPEP_0184694372 /NCGR_PEP_ID=MMETSP0313-20130426/2366_1 /TAXON_ID=2792 /ORGANISM="Porphyridium aerugineum, Strain SAG 1380-2" /LENGTH=393 /DNA_ID=CAMNT_0027152663 /DNA_START=312 /DNA_END=1493 /DNA_ORIENTATION=+